ncbi:Rieske (2Fe-2S) domain protein [Halorubrum saccharovorum DSM 1137]|uniref:Rieske (2Fe-2S) domain protein n=1 Tax=Halorubrum saccharovorum DSM 1137 TaxID=1227484 RepID=M0DR29_9EURY|nr:Rieske 2Fe-2S domain-containing protein [Halorubrum saccharovorum]ELZ37945.1 Rieske (2Fe-2S) domain protein [Halorubrum saccharovorum DSM 1137]
MDADRRIAAVEEVPEDSTLLVTLRPVDPESVDDGEGDVGEAEDGTPEAEAVLTRAAGEVRAFRNYCQHWTDVRLDKDDGAFVRNGEVFCQTHGATFEADGGYCNFGPCEGAVLESVAVSVDGDAVFLDDDAYEFVRVGHATRDDDAGDSRIDFTGN